MPSVDIAQDRGQVTEERPFRLIPTQKRVGPAHLHLVPPDPVCHLDAAHAEGAPARGLPCFVQMLSFCQRSFWAVTHHPTLSVAQQIHNQPLRIVCVFGQLDPLVPFVHRLLIAQDQALAVFVGVLEHVSRRGFARA